MMKIWILIFGLFCITSMGCGHLHTVEEVGPAKNEVVVSIGGEEVKSGDLLEIYTKVCKKVLQGRSAHPDECSKKILGEASVVKVIDHDSALVRLPPDLKFEPTLRFEKKESYGR